MGWRGIITKMPVGLYRQLRVLYGFLLRERRFAVKVRLADRIRMYLNGFFSESAVLYDFKKHGMEHYLTDIERLKTEHINGGLRVILDNKVVFKLVMPEAFNVPENIMIIDKGVCLPLSGTICSISDLYDAVMGGEDFIIKPECGGGGDGVYFLEAAEGVFMVNRKPADKAKLERIAACSGPMVVCRMIRQSEFSRRLYPHSVNTLRVLTGISPSTGKPLIMGAVQRIGTGQSAPMDNIGKGGIVVHIDVETGTFGEGAVYPGGLSTLKKIRRHPETGFEFTGLVHPRWKAIADTLKSELNDRYPVYTGWDIISTEEGFSVIEGNNYSGVSVLQMHEPLLKKKENREFFRYHGIITE